MENKYNMKKVVKNIRILTKGLKLVKKHEDGTRIYKGVRNGFEIQLSIFPKVCFQKRKFKVLPRMKERLKESLV